MCNSPYSQRVLPLLQLKLDHPRSGAIASRKKRQMTECHLAELGRLCAHFVELPVFWGADEFAGGFHASPECMSAADII